MRISDAFPSKHLKASDLQGQRVRVMMNHVDIQKIGDDNKPVLYFQGKQKGLVLNKTNSNAIVSAYGDDTNSWTGQPIELFEAMVDFQGKTVPAIRISIPRQNTQAPLQQPQPQQPNSYAAARSGEDSFTPPPQQQAAPAQRSRIDDEIPF